MLEMKKLYVCPYCGIEDKLENFIIKIGRQYVRCPLCEERMYIKTLLAEFTPEEWGKWIYVNVRLFNSPRFKFYDKVHWDLLFTNIKVLYSVEYAFKKGFYGAKREWGTYDAKQWLHDIEIKYNMIKPRNLTWKEKEEMGLILEAYI